MAPAPAPTVVPMKAWRVWLVFALVALLVVGHAIDIYGMREHWPFSHYPMYARVEKKKRLELLGLFGLLRAPGYRGEVWLTDGRYVPPLNEGRLRVILMAAYRRGTDPKNIEDTRQVMEDYMRAYEARRVAGLHDGPRMLELTLYRMTWRLREDGTHATRPRTKEPLMKLTWRDLDQRATPPADPAPLEGDPSDGLIER